MRVVLMRPAYSNLYELIKIKAKRMHVVPPMGLMYVAANLMKNGHQVKIIDGEAKQYNLEQTIHQINMFEPDVVGVGSTTPEFHDASNILRKVKENNSNIITLLGGPHPTVLPEEVLTENSHVDYLVRFEGEQTTIELLEHLENKKPLDDVAGIAFRNGSEVIITPDRELIDINENLWPARELIDAEDYVFNVPQKGMRLMTAIQSSRGCPNRCNFCYRMFGQQIRFRDPIKVVDEIEFCIRNYNVDWISFIDDTLTINKNRIIQLCDEMITRKLDIKWICLARADTLNREALVKMKEAGCVQVSMGVESGNQDILNILKKGTTLDQYREGYKLLREVGFETRGSFILGHAHDTRDSIMDTINFALELDLDRAFFNICTPYPGTELYEKALKGDGIRLITDDWKEFKRWGNAVIELDGMKRDDLIALQKKAMRDFYVRPKVILNHVKKYFQGERDGYYYRPLLSAIKDYLHLS